MAFEQYPEHIEDFAFHPIRARPYPCEARAGFSVREVRFHSQPSVFWNRVKLNDNIELLTRALRPVDRGLVYAHIEESFFVIVQEAAEVDQRLLLYANNLLAKRSNGF